MNITLVEKKGQQWDILLGMSTEPIGVFLVNFGKVMFLPASKTMWSAEMMETILTKARELQQTI